MVFDPKTINGLAVWIDSETGVNAPSTGGPINGLANQIGMTPPAPTPIASFTSALRTGTNIVGYESAVYNGYNINNGPPTSSYPVYSQVLQDWLKTNGVGNVRITFSWEALQSSLGGPVPAAATGNYKAYFDNYVNTVKAFLSKGMTVMCEPWGYNANIKDTDICYRGGSFTPAQFADFWGKFAAAVNNATGNDQRVCFGLMNEPHTANNGPAGSVGITLANWFACAQAAITAIRATGATNAIAVSGMNYGDSALFVSNGSAAEYLKLVDSKNNLIVSVHNYNGLNKSKNTALRDSTSALVSWARANKVKVHISEIAIDAGAPKSSLAIAQAQWADWTNFVNDNKDVIIGWCWWATGAKNWWNTDDSSSGFHWGLCQNGTDNSPSVYMNLIQTSLVGNGVVADPVPAPPVITNDFAGVSPNRPVWKNKSNGSNFGFGNKHSISFEGTPDYLTLKDSVSLSNGCTYWMVVKFNATDIGVTNSKNAPMTLFGDYDPATSLSQFGFSSGVMKLRCKVKNSWVSFNSKRGIYNDGQMHCIACTHDLLGNVNFYVDGVLTDSFVGASYNNKTMFNILGAGQNKVDPFLGQVAEAMVFDGALTCLDIANLTIRASEIWK